MEPEITPTPAETPALKTLSLREFLNTDPSLRPPVLMRELVQIPIGNETAFTVEVVQLSKKLFEEVQKKVRATTPKVPTIPVVYDRAHRDPNDQYKVRPAGTYHELNEQDPDYQKDVENWFATSCVWMALYSAAGSLDLDPMNPEAMQEAFDKLISELPSPTLREFALAAARVNPGLYLAVELLEQDKKDKLLQQAAAEVDKLASVLAELPPEETLEPQVLQAT